MSEAASIPGQAVEYLRSAGVSLAILFGSRATGRHSAQSDWDLGVLSDSSFDVLRASAELGRIVGGRVDVVNLRRGSGVGRAPIEAQALGH